ncbi:Mut7-C RNAse domain-containing protein [Phytohalomonas tamaricis]|uniref:Mut7-C RNAse domain-containing protein n=1 Tax=Phytohalomonas tamaricis TaxID=2081032 RepID=UPI000D0B51A7|nr:Mut7-C RNAse domain-containing protein [Phytohalomonas tamaricis]
MATACFHFHHSLNDFLPRAQRGAPIIYTFERRASIKDAVEALGVPHTEVAALVVDGYAVGFDALLNDDGNIDVYPHEALPQGIAPYMLRLPPPWPPRFVLDAHLGRLARYLRLLGFDSDYRNDFGDAELAEISAREGRILLSRDRSLLKRRIIEHAYFVRADAPMRQLEEVCVRWELFDEIAAFQRCTRCNGILHEVAKESVIDLLEPKTRRYFEHFRQCDRCAQVYWQGSHFERMQRWINDLKARRSG